MADVVHEEPESPVAGQGREPAERRGGEAAPAFELEQESKRGPERARTREPERATTREPERATTRASMPESARELEREPERATTREPATEGADPLGVLVGALVFGVTAGIAIAYAAPAAHWLDSSELAAASFELGNAHPPGHPLPILLGKLVSLVPLGSIAFRTSCASALALGLAALVLLLCIRRATRLAWRELFGEARPLGRFVLHMVSACGALGLTLGPAALYQGVRAEVYALNLAITLGMLHLALRLLEHGRTRDLLLAALLAGLGAGNHHLLTLLAVPPVVLAWLLGNRVGLGCRARQGGLALGAGLVGLLVLGQLPARSSAGPEINWGAPHTVERFGWTVSARLFARTAERSLEKGPTRRLGSVARAAHAELGGGLLVAALAGAILLGLRRRLWGAGGVLGLAALGSAFAALLGGFEPQNPDSQGYLLLALSVLALLSATALTLALAWLQSAPGIRPALGQLTLVVAASAVVWPAQGLAGSLPRADLRGAEGAEVMAETLLDAAPPRALLLSAYYQTTFALWAARILNGARPDVDHVARTFLAQPGYVEGVTRRRPGLAPLLRGMDRPEALDARRLGRVLGQRAVLFEPDHDTLTPDLVRDAEPWGFLRRLRPPGDPRARPSEEARRHARARWAPLEARLVPHRRDSSTRLWLLWAYFLDAHFERSRGHCAGARFGFERARKVGNPGDPLLARLASDCGFADP